MHTVYTKRSFPLFLAPGNRASDVCKPYYVILPCRELHGQSSEQLSDRGQDLLNVGIPTGLFIANMCIIVCT